MVIMGNECHRRSIDLFTLGALKRLKICSSRFTRSLLCVDVCLFSRE